MIPNGDFSVRPKKGGIDMKHQFRQQLEITNNLYLVFLTNA